MIIYLKNLFNNTIKSREDVEAISREIPLVGELPHIEKKGIDMVTKNDQ